MPIASVSVWLMLTKIFFTPIESAMASVVPLNKAYGAPDGSLRMVMSVNFFQFFYGVCLVFLAPNIIHHLDTVLFNHIQLIYVV